MPQPRKRKRPVPPPRFLTDRELCQVLEGIQLRFGQQKNKAEGRRKYSLLTKLFAYAGVKMVEALELRPADFDWDAAKVRVRTSRRREPTYRTIPLHPDLRLELLTYMVFAGRDKDSRESLFGLTEAAVECFYQRLTRKLGFAVNCHLLRNTFAVRALMTQCPASVVQEWMGHTTIFKTGRYVEIAQMDTAEEMQRVPWIGRPLPDGQAPPEDDKGS